MSGTLNKVMLIGHLGDDVKMHYFDDKNCIGRFPLATDETYTNKQTGKRVTNTDWHNIVVRNRAAEICEQYLAKGDLIFVEGRLKNRKWQDEKGQDRFSTEIHVTDFKFLSYKKGNASHMVSSAGQTVENHKEPNLVSEPDETDNDLPF